MPDPPLSRSNAWVITPELRSAEMFSPAALGLPGKVTTSVDPIVPATGREREARGVIWIDELSKRWTTPGAERSKSGDIA